MFLTSRHVLITFVACGSIAGIVMACGSTTSTFPEGGPTPSVFGDGGFGEGGSNPGQDLYKNDPPPPYCGPETGVTPPPPITGSLDCPSDKNKPGCACDNVGEEKPCWTGLRRHRNLGICKDGVARCEARSENVKLWGECTGQTLPIPDGKGKEACSCFSAGIWKITNTSPCLYTPNGTSYKAYSTGGDTATGCNPPNGTPPGGIWSSNSLKVDCEGTFRLCFKIRAGQFESPKASDCTLGEVCVDAQYLQKGVEQRLSDLPGWTGSDDTCAAKWEKDTPPDISPGYGEMIVKGQSFACDAIDDGAGGDLVFHRVQYCPRICRPSNQGQPGGYQPDAAICRSCQLSGQGQF